MLSKNEEKLIKSLQTKKGREKSGFCLVEGQRVMETAGNAVQMSLSRLDTENFDGLVTTETPQAMAGVAKIPQWKIDDVKAKEKIVVLDGVRDPGNVGAILRLCLGFDAGLMLIDSADVTSPKVVRASVGAMFSVPWIKIKRHGAEEIIQNLQREIYRLEKVDGASSIYEQERSRGYVLVVGSEGGGISLLLKAKSLFIPHSNRLESLNAANALAIVLSADYR